VRFGRRAAVIYPSAGFILREFGKVKARQLIASASYGPDRLRAISKAFDDAWEQIAPTISTRAEAVDARMKLAKVVLTLAGKGIQEPDQMTKAAVKFMSDGPIEL
jgi:hypothetical protein